MPQLYDWIASATGLPPSLGIQAPEGNHFLECCGHHFPPLLRQAVHNCIPFPTVRVGFSLILRSIKISVSFATFCDPGQCLRSHGSFLWWGTPNCNYSAVCLSTFLAIVTWCVFRDFLCDNPCAHLWYMERTPSGICMLNSTRCKCCFTPTMG